ncbi:MAG: pyridoxamine 5'-phosphate oxidase family protein [Bryobacteraceae bacterium]|nr:pyridoxamine 5'-phosphate oxidase family protein [Bryobacteraceae bacterium]
MAQTHEDSVRKLGELIHEVKVAMLTTVEPDGQLRSRPMATQGTDFDGQLWFFTALDSSKVDEVQREEHVNVAYSQPDKQIYVSVSGKASVSRDKAKLKELWNPIHKAWFPKGLEDPHLGLLCVDVDRAEYWDAPSAKLVQLFGFVKAVVTGKAYGEEGVEHEKVTL